MKRINFKKLLLMTIISFIFVFGNSKTVFAKTNAETGYKLTIFVDEGENRRNGHVFIGLTGGDTTIHAGWRSESNALDAPWGGDGGKIVEESDLAVCDWDVKKTYNITQEGYQRAVNGMVDWENSGKLWTIRNHCGDFAETIAQMAGVSIKLSWSATTGARPKLFGNYLKQQGGAKQSNTFFVNSFVNTNLPVNRGDKIAIRASGKIFLGPLAGWGTPEGIEYGVLYNLFYNIRHGSLVGRIRTPNAGLLDNWFLVGNGIEGTAQSTGTLELNVNDSNPENNQQTFKVRVCKEN